MASSLRSPSPARPVSSKSLESLLQCSVCLEKFDSMTRSPRQLQCHHTFCLHCLTSIAGNNEQHLPRPISLSCPTCRQEHKLGQGGVQQIPADHKIVQLLDILSVAEKESDKFCKKHGQQQLSFFCKPCEVPVCRDCTVVSHNHADGHHKIVEISEALEEFSTQFTDTRDRAKDISEKLQARSNMSNKAIEQLTKNEASLESQIRKTFAGYHAELEVREKVLLSQLKGDVSKNKEEIEVLRDLVDHEASTFTKLDEQFEEARKQGDIRRLFDVMHQMKKWETSSTDLTNDKDERQWYEYKPQNETDYSKDVTTLGSIEKKPGLLQQEFVTEPGSSKSNDDLLGSLTPPPKRLRSSNSSEEAVEASDYDDDEEVPL